MVNFAGISVAPDDVIYYLKKNLKLREAYRQILVCRAVYEAAQECGVSVSSDEIQADADRTRREHHLEKASDTLNWLNTQLMTAEDWEAGIRDRILADKLATTLFSKEVERFFIQHQLEFDRVLLYQIVVPYAQLAQELFYQIDEKEISFYEAAHLYDVQEKRRHQCGYEGWHYRWSLVPELSAAAFSGTLSQVVRPIQTDQGHHLLLVEEHIPAQLTDEIRQQIIQRLFAEWLNGELRQLMLE
ncbi:peptidylprolyl isomerase [Myxacorys almedinensis]|uniref:peptidylprolyl isomerase n=1 Tax=Myxacorys almedinensis A TaxID=2690445 RepID=A0A8J8CL66_9CYAN|nr:peptidylprolyl isomerase [Myxacorys almedinensis]NDJ19296.1 peptidylprolyl isomerase [Myxacorys almedinensis A]